MNNRLQQIQWSLAEAIRCNRAAQQWSQQEAADKLKMHRAYYSAIERGEKNVTLGTLLRICDLYGVTLHTLFLEVNSPIVLTRRSGRVD